MGHTPYHPPDFDNITIVGGSLTVALPSNVKKACLLNFFRKSITYKEKNPSATIRRIEIKDGNGQLRFAFEPENGKCLIGVVYERVLGPAPGMINWLKWHLGGRQRGSADHAEPDEPHTHADERGIISDELEAPYVNAAGRQAGPHRIEEREEVRH